jgi:hypothetical protein
MQKIDEKTEAEIRQFWETNLHTGYLYHGTSTIVLDKILRYGLVPGMVPWDKYDFNRIMQLFDKAGRDLFRHVLVEWRQYDKAGQGIFLTAMKDVAIGYSKMGSDVLNHFLNMRYAQENKKNEALLSEIYYRIIDLSRNVSIDTWNQLRILFIKNRKAFDEEILKYTALNRQEINELLGFFNKYWEIIANSRSIILYISTQIPSFLEDIAPEYGNYEYFKERALKYCKYMKLTPELNSIKQYYEEELIHSLQEITITERIPAKFIIKYEYAD